MKLVDPIAPEPPPSRDSLIRDLIEIRDQIAANLAHVDALIADEGRAWADAIGQKPRATIDQLRREATAK